jgi:hypothetical protein
MMHTAPSAQGRQHGTAAGPSKSHWHSIVAHRAARAHVASRARADEACDISDPSCDFPDPEAKFRRFGRNFGGGYRLSADWLQDVPRVRVRRSEERAKDELLELAVLNERLAGNMEPWEARQRLEYLRMRRKNWEHVYDYVTKADVAATVALIEEASEKASDWAPPGRSGGGGKGAAAGQRGAKQRPLPATQGGAGAGAQRGGCLFP